MAKNNIDEVNLVARGGGDNSLVVLVDFDNFYPRRLEQGDNSDSGWLGHEISRMVTEALHFSPLSQIIRIRFYGGWMERGVLTRGGSMLQQTINAMNPFPIPNRAKNSMLRGEIMLATRLLHLPLIEWEDTYRSRAGPPRLRLAHSTYPEGCAGASDTCPVRTLQHFTRKKGKGCPVPGCTVTNDNAFMVVEQKMVDTMIACDLLALCQYLDVGGVMVLSDDSDLLPPMAMGAAISKKRLMLVNSATKKTNPYKALLESLDIDVRVWEGP
jgi:hypothetical protein